MITRIKELTYDTVAKKFIARDPSGKKTNIPVGESPPGVGDRILIDSDYNATDTLSVGQQTDQGTPLEFYLPPAYYDAQHLDYPGQPDSRTFDVVDQTIKIKEGILFTGFITLSVAESTDTDLRVRVEVRAGPTSDRSSDDTRMLFTAATIEGEVTFVDDGDNSNSYQIALPVFSVSPARPFIWPFIRNRSVPDLVYNSLGFDLTRIA